MPSYLFPLLLCLLLLSTSHAEEQKNQKDPQSTKPGVSVRADEWMPHNGKPNAKLPGYMIEIAEYALTKGGYQLDYQLMPWERSLDLVAKGKIDCVVGAFKSDARDFIFHKKSYGKEDVAFYGRSDARAWRYENNDSFKGYTIAAIGGYSYGPLIDAYIAHPNSDVHVAKGDDALERNIKMLLTKRVDILVESPAVFDFKSRSLPSTAHIKELDRRGKPDDLYFACSPENPESKTYVKLLDDGITDLRKKKKLQPILDKYGLKDWKK